MTQANIPLITQPVGLSDLDRLLYTLTLEVNASGIGSAPIVPPSPLLPGGVNAALNSFALSVNAVTAADTVGLLSGAEDPADLRSLLNTMILQINAFGGGSSYTAKAVHFDAHAYLARSGTLTGVSDSSTGTLFYWFRSEGDSSDDILISIPGYNLDPYDRADNIVNTSLSDGTNSFSGGPPTSIFDGGPPIVPNIYDASWYGIARSWDVSDPDSANWTCVTVIGEAGSAPTIFPVFSSGEIRTGVGFNVKWNDEDVYVMGDGFQTNYREVAQFWASPSVVMTGAELIAAFWGSDNKPKSLGTNGELPTGTSPPIYCDGDADTFGQPNLGTGGGLTLTGTVTNASTSPSD